MNDLAPVIPAIMSRICSDYGPARTGLQTPSVRARRGSHSVGSCYSPDANAQ